MTQDAARRCALYGIFVASGFTSLIYESIWSHYLKLFLGHAAYSRRSCWPSSWGAWRGFVVDRATVRSARRDGNKRRTVRQGHARA